MFSATRFMPSRNGVTTQPSERKKPARSGAAPSCHVAQRHPVEFREPPVGVAHDAIELPPEPLIAAQFLTRPRRDLQKADVAKVLRISPEQAAECLEPVDQSFRVVEPINANGERPIAEALVEPPSLPACPPPAPPSCSKTVRIDTDRIDDGLHVPPFYAGSGLPAGSGNTEDLAHTIKNTFPIDPRMESHYVIDEHIESSNSAARGSAWSRAGGTNGVCSKEPMRLRTPRRRSSSPSGNR